jgi:hypothetical protein
MRRNEDQKKEPITSNFKEIQGHANLTPRLIDSNMYSDVISNVRSKKNAPNSIVAAKVEVLLKRLLYTFPTAPAILLAHGSDQSDGSNIAIRDIQYVSDPYYHTKT